MNLKSIHRHLSIIGPDVTFLTESNLIWAYLSLIYFNAFHLIFQMFSFLPGSVGQFQNSHAITLPLPTSSRISNRILFLILPSELLLPDLCSFCLPAKLQQMSYVLRIMGQSLHEFRWFCRLLEWLYLFVCFSFLFVLGLFKIFTCRFFCSVGHSS